jgi:AcrR family transcriptional regulator
LSEKVATRERILTAALGVFAEKGYHRASVDDIVHASGTSKGGVYHHFATKEAIFLALVDDFAARLSRRWKAHWSPRSRRSPTISASPA